jgi:hypothetical protein
LTKERRISSDPVRREGVAVKLGKQVGLMTDVSGFPAFRVGSPQRSFDFVVEKLKSLTLSRSGVMLLNNGGCAKGTPFP